MLKSFSVSNYRKFNGTVTLDLGSPRDYSFNSDYVTNGIVSNALVIGQNASGKTNLIRAILDVTTNYYPPNLFAAQLGYDATFVNADAERPEAEFEYIFAIGGRTVSYGYAKNSDRQLTRERLEVDGTLVFDYSNSAERMVKENLSFIGAETANLRFSGDYSSMLAYLSSNVSAESDGILSSLRRYTARIIPIVHVGESARSQTRRILAEVIQSNRVDELEVFLSRFGVEEHLSVYEDADGSKALYCLHRRLIPFSECMSSGTRTLINLFYAYEMHPQGSIYLLDEFDAYCHFEVAEDLIRYFGKATGCQTIATTHNTSLTRNDVMRPDCIFKFGADGALKPLSERTSRELRIGNNVEKLLRNGEFD
ncbi:MAG: AAA family ATPase [Atopobiaceae bacterium]|nr:AAA family ATPase [Atopobiaceae bacterium]